MGTRGRRKKLMKRLRITGATLMVAAGLVGAVAAPASAAGPPPGKGLATFGTWTCDGFGEVDLLGPSGAKAGSVYMATGEHIILFSLDIHGTFEGEPFDFSKTYGQKSALAPFTCTQHFVDVGTDLTYTLVGGVAPPQ